MSMTFEVVSDMAREIAELEITCSKCGTITEGGKLRDPMAKMFVFWEGPKKSRLKRKKAWITAFRCTKCGYIEMWAPDLD